MCLNRVCDSLGVTETYTYLFNVGLTCAVDVQMVAAILESVKEALEDQQSNLESKDIHEKCIIGLNWGAFAKAIDALQRILMES